LVGKKYSGEEGERFGPRLAAEHLASDDYVEVNAQTLRALDVVGRAMESSAKRRVHRKRRERKEHVGNWCRWMEAFNEWLEGRGFRVAA